MRITQKSIATRTVSSVQNILEAVGDKMNEVASGKKLSKPSTNPVDAERVLRYGKRLAASSQHSRNVDVMSTRLNQGEAVMNSSGSLLAQVRELGIQMVNGTPTASDRENASQRLDQLQSQFVRLGNTKVGNQYIFSGSKTSTKPYEERNGRVIYNGNDSEIKIEVEEDLTIAVNIPGSQLFDTGSGGIFDELNKLKGAINAKDTDAIREKIENIDKIGEKLVKVRTENATTIKRIESVSDLLIDDQSNMARIISQIEDADMANAATELLNIQNAYQAALSVAGRAVQQSSLVNILG